MKTKNRTPEQLAKEIERLRRRIAALEAVETEQKQSQEELRQSEKRVETIFRAAPIGIGVVTNRVLMEVNTRICEMTGYSREELVGSSARILYSTQDDFEYVGAEKYRQIDEKGTGAVETRWMKKDGTIIDVLLSSTPIDVSDRSRGVTFTALDITDRKQAEEQIRQSEQQFQGLVETLNDWIWEVDQNGIYTYVSPKVRDLLGYEPEEVLGKTPFDLMPIEEARRVQGIFEQLQAVRQPVIALENINHHKDGHLVVLETSGIPFFDAEGHLQGYRGVDRDITDRKHAEEELERSYRQLRETFIETVNALASTVEMKDPYTAGHQRWATRLACAIAKEMGLSEEQIEGIRMAGLIHDIGKINIPAEILSKPGQLSAIQYNMVKIHAQVGCDILREIKFPWPVAKIVLQHHERWDGSGYPERLSGEEIILEARILAVADTVEAMSSHRPYRIAHGIDSALEEISQNRDTLYDPAVVDACLTLFEKGFRFD